MFSTQPQALGYIFLCGFWCVFLYFMFTIRGRSGNVIGFFVIAQLIFGLVLGFQMVHLLPLLGVPIILISAGLFTAALINSRG